jgi:type I restriction enzyme S subunit
MNYNETLKREIPLGWDCLKLGDLQPNIVTGKTPPTTDSNNFEGPIPFICIGDVRGNMHIVKTELTLSEKGANLQKNKFIPKGSLCVTCIASPGLVGFATRDSQTNQQLNSVVFRDEANRYFLYFYLADYFKYSSGAKTGNTFANMNKGDFEAINVLTPERNLRDEYTRLVANMFDGALNNAEQNKELTALRDWLLPMLMNGQVTVTAEDRS